MAIFNSYVKLPEGTIFRCTHIFGQLSERTLVMNCHHRWKKWRQLTLAQLMQSDDNLGRKAFQGPPIYLHCCWLHVPSYIYVYLSRFVCFTFDIIWSLKWVKSWNSWLSICLIRWFNPFSIDFPDLTEVFGLPPLVHTDDPTRAVLACFDMLKAAGEIGHQTTATCWRGRLDIFS